MCRVCNINAPQKGVRADVSDNQQGVVVIVHETGAMNEEIHINVVQRRAHE
jgi:hypothetical protein